jgi:hypothetical protein
MKEVLLYGGLVALVDDADYELVSQYKWHAKRWRTTFYAGACLPGHHHLRMHRLILGAPAGIEVDHQDRDGLNNQRGNIRLATHSQNQANAIKHPLFKGRGTSTFKGVTRMPYGRWVARICVDREWKYLGYFASESDAALAYNNAALLHFGEFARLNDV